ncbi:hypothetical protein ACWDKQ_13210 [Saccharopolyspora sp. NPDC000995]
MAAGQLPTTNPAAQAGSFPLLGWLFDCHIGDHVLLPTGVAAIADPAKDPVGGKAVALLGALGVEQE